MNLQRGARLALALAHVLAALAAPSAEAASRRSKSGTPKIAASIVVDMNTGTILHSEAAEQPRPPASLTKMMTLYVLFGYLRAGKITPDTELVVTNGGKTEAEVAIILFDASGQSVHAYNLKIPAGGAVLDTEPFRNRAKTPDVDWGFATVTVLKGANVITSGSMIDMKTNDPTTIPAKQ